MEGLLGIQPKLCEAPQPISVEMASIQTISEGPGPFKQSASDSVARTTVNSERSKFVDNGRKCEAAQPPRHTRPKLPSAVLRASQYKARAQLSREGREEI